MAKKLEVNDLTVSFKTSNGKVQAVRGINFYLDQGETLAIVGESGSGKSVTSKAILGILAGNSIVEGGEIIYDGKDLLKIPEDEFHKIRGDKIAMIFQDPMSSLNPIVRIGQQLTEAMLLKGKMRQKENRRNFNSLMAQLSKRIIQAIASDDEAKKAEIQKKCADFDKFEYKHLELENAYNNAHTSAVEGAAEATTLAFEISKGVFKDLNYRISQVITTAKKAVHKYVVNEKSEQLLQLCNTLKGKVAIAKKSKDFSEVICDLNAVAEILDETKDFLMPNFFAMGYYLTFVDSQIPDMPVEELNQFLRKTLDDKFMLDFIDVAEKGISYSAERAYAHKEEFIKVLDEILPIFEKENLVKKDCLGAIKVLRDNVIKTIDKLEIVKDSIAYTFISSLKNEVNTYFSGIHKNEKETKRYNNEKAKYDKIVAKGKVPNGEVIPLALVDFELIKQNIKRLFVRLKNHYIEAIENKKNRNYHEETIAVIDYLKACASGVVNKVTKKMAKSRAIKLMEEVGIDNPRKRYSQYPFEFSGGMRQRIVIAIALAADPDILICDEPTTALDVTIQSQILELINNLKRERNLTVIFITHDLGVVANMADRIAVMYAGKIVEYGTSEDIFYDPRHPYTWALLSSMPDLDTNEKLDAIPGTPPNMIYPPKGDAFAARNKYAMKIDFEMQPPMFKISETHQAATWLLHPDAPKVDPPKIVSDRIARMLKKTEEGSQDGQ